MKKFLTVLLVIAVMFTFSFGSAFAAAPVKMYTADEAAAALETVMNNNLVYVNAAKTQYLAAFTYDKDGFAATHNGYDLTGDPFSGYQKAGIEAGADKVVDLAKDAMKAAIRAIIDVYPTAGVEASTLDGYKAQVAAAVTNYAGDNLTTMVGFAAVVADNTATIEKVQADATKAYYEGLIAKNYNAENYPATGSYKASGTGEALTAKGVVEYVVAEAEKDIAEAYASATKTAAQKMAAYEQAYTDMVNLFNTFVDKNGAKVPTITSAAEAEAAEAIAVTNAIAALKAYATGAYYATNDWTVPAAGSTDVTNIKSWAEYWTIPGVAAAEQPIYVAKTATKNATVFGVEIANVEQVTRAELVALNAAFYQAILKTVDVAEVYAGVEGSSAVAALYNTGAHTVFHGTLKNAMMLAAVYEDVVDYGDDLKNLYIAGDKQYDDAKVDAAVKAAEEFVYGDLGSGFAAAADYIVEAVADIEKDATIDTLAEALAELKIVGECPYETFLEAIEDAQEKFIPSIITYGEKKTADADKKYAKNFYAVSEVNAAGTTYGTLYENIKTDVLADLADAQSYEEIEAIMAEADEELAKLLPAEGADKVTAARAKYVLGLADYVAQAQDIIGDAADGYADATYADAKAAGEKLIKNAITVDAVKAAFEEAKTIVAGVQNDDTIDAAEEAVEKAIDALPYVSKLTVADKDAVAAVREAVDALPYGASVLTTRLETSEAKIFELEKKVLDEQIKATEKAINALGGLMNDKDAEAAVAMKADVEAVAAAMKAHNDAIAAYNKAYNKSVAHTVSSTVIGNFLALADAGNSVYGAELYLARTAINNLEKSGKAVDVVAVKEAKDLYEALTDKQQYQLVCEGVAESLLLAQDALIAEVEALKITAGSSAKKGSITVKWDVEGEAAVVDGYEIWKSTKKNSGFKKAFTTEKMSYKNTKGLKKGTRYYYKVRAIATIDGEKITSDWSNKAYRVAK